MNDYIQIILSQLAYSPILAGLGTDTSRINIYNYNPILLETLISQNSAILNDLTKRNMSLPEELLDWQLLAIHDKNNESGFVGLAFLTPKDEVVLVFRGSESIWRRDTLMSDWINTDMELLKGNVTDQDVEMQYFVKKLILQNHITDTTPIYTTGHSLGGYLSVASAVYLTELGYGSQIVSATNYDGPGFSQEYMAEHRAALESIAPKVTANMWSFVGGTLTHHPESLVRLIETKHLDQWDAFIVRHSLEHVLFDDNGNVRETTVAPRTWQLSNWLTNKIDNIPYVDDIPIVLFSAVLIYGRTLSQLLSPPEDVPDFFLKSYFFLLMGLTVAVVPSISVIATVVIFFVAPLLAVLSMLILAGLIRLAENLINYLVTFFSEQPPVQRLAQRPAIHNRQYAGAAYGMVVFHERDAQRHIKMLENIYHMILGVAHQIPNPERLQACLKDVRLLVSCIEGYRDRITNIERTILSRFEQAHRQAARPSGRYRHP